MTGPAGTPTPTHWLRPNEREWTPAHAIYVDTETAWEDLGGGQLHRLRCWVAVSVNRRDGRKDQPAETWAAGTDAKELAEQVDAWTTGRRASWLFCHNLAFDLAASRLVENLAGLGWALGAWGMGDRSLWLRLRKNNRGLCLADSGTWLPVGLDEVAPYVAIVKPPLPANSDGSEPWAARCRADTEILAAAMGQLMDWWDTAGVGNWSVTGGACGWNALRHRMPAKSVLIAPDPAALAAERAACYGGRRDAQRHGVIDGGPFLVADMADAYPAVAAHLPLPRKRVEWRASWPVQTPLELSARYGLLARARIVTETPRYPLRQGRSVFYPVGQFWTTLAQPDLYEAAARGELAEIGAGWRYLLDGHLMDWAGWVIDLSHGRIAGAPPVTRLFGRRSGRAAIGRWALRISETTHLGPAWHAGWGAMGGRDMTAGAPLQIVDMMGERYQLTRDVDADDAFPAVLAFVEAEVRVRLAAMLDRLGDSWVSANTDGAVVDLAAAARTVLGAPHRARSGPGWSKVADRLCEVLSGLTTPLRVRPKKVVADLWLSGPASLTLDGRPFIAGLPRSAVGSVETGFDGLHWPGLAWQMEHGHPGGYVRPAQHYRVPAVTVHRWALADGSAVPCAVSLDAAGNVVFASWSDTPGTAALPTLAATQSRAVSTIGA